MRRLWSIFLLAMMNNPAKADGGIDWRWDRDTSVCALIQDGRSSGEKVEVSRTPANDETDLYVTLSSAPKFRESRLRDAIIDVSPTGAFAADAWLHADETKRLQALAVIQDPAFMRSLSSATEFRISRREMGESVRVPLKSAAAAVAALRSCEDRKMREWGIDPIAWWALQSHPVPLQSLRDMFSALDYPMEALSFLVTGDAVTRLDVAPDGSVSQCKSLNASQYKGFEDATCNVLKRARFKPAVDTTGASVTAPYVIDVKFRIGS